MRAGLVTLATDVDLQCLELSPAQGQAMFGQFGFKTIHVSEGENAGRVRIFQKSKCGSSTSNSVSPERNENGVPDAAQEDHFLDDRPLIVVSGVNFARYSLGVRPECRLKRRRNERESS